MRPPVRVLLDADGDGFADSLRGALYLPDLLTLEGVQAGAELITWLSRDALCLSFTTHHWSAPQPAIFIGEKLPDELPLEPHSATLTLSPDALLLTAVSDAELLLGARKLNSWPLQETLGRLCDGHSAAALARFVLDDSLVTLHLDADLAQVPNWALLPSDLSACVTPGALYTNPNATLTTPTSSEPQFSLSPTYFSLGQAFRGGGLFTGVPNAPEIFRGSLSIEVPQDEALAVAARLCTEGVRSPATLTGPAAATVRLLLGTTKGAEVRIRDTELGSVLELAGHSSQDLARAASYVADTFPFLPDGTDFEKLEANLTAFLKGDTPIGRVARLAGLQASLGTRPSRALLPNPPSTAPLLLGMPVTNTARDGERTCWDATFEWEGDRCLAALAAFTWNAGDRVVVEGYLSESKSVRELLETRIHDLLQGRGVAARVSLRSAYKSGLCWLLEEIGPRLAELNVAELTVACKIQSFGLELEDRWLRELYPAQTLLEQAYGVRVVLTLGGGEETYRVVGVDGSGHTVLEGCLTPPTTETPLNGIAATGVVHPTSGQLTVRRGSSTLLEQPLNTDRDLFWAWFTQTVLPEVSRRVIPGTSGPYFGELSVVLTMSEPDDALGLDHEHLSATESLHEDIYFGTLEALHSAAELDPEDRSFAPGRILPFCNVAQAQATKARVMLRDPSSYRLGLADQAGTVYKAPSVFSSASARSVELLPNEPPHVTVNIDLGSAEAAQISVAQLEWARDYRKDLAVWDPFPAGSRLSICVHALGQPMRTVTVPSFTAPISQTPLPERPLLTREVTAYSHSLAHKFPNVYLRPLRESLFGAPLVALEMTSPTPHASRARLAAWKPTVLISARQHANEPSSTNAMFHWLEQKLAENSLLKHLNIVFHPLENPDGARLHAALCQLSARHMHHAARYTGTGADLQVNPLAHGVVIPESELRNETGRRWQPLLHLNCHGYPAHEWVRANGGYIPRHFEAWSLPFGYFTILSSASDDTVLLEQFKSVVGRALAQHPELQRKAQAQITRARQHMRRSEFPFILEEEFPFSFVSSKVYQQARQDLAPKITVITEVPDETVSGTLWQHCVKAHQIIGEATLHTLLTTKTVL